MKNSTSVGVCVWLMHGNTQGHCTFSVHLMMCSQLSQLQPTWRIVRGNCVTAIEHWAAANRLNLEKWRVIIVPNKIGGPPPTLGRNHVTTPFWRRHSSTSRSAYRLLQSPNLILDKHITSLSHKCFFITVATTILTFISEFSRSWSHLLDPIVDQFLQRVNIALY